MLISFILIAVILLWMEGKKLKEIQSEIEIGASPEKVWSVLTNIDNWKKWNPTINHASGDAVVGAKLSIIIRDEDGKDGAEYMPIVTVIQESKLFEWRVNMLSGFIFTNGRIFELEKTTNGTRLINKETFKGMLVPIFWSKLSGYVPSSLKEMNDALKDQVEKELGEGSNSIVRTGL